MVLRTHALHSTHFDNGRDAANSLHDKCSVVCSKAWDLKLNRAFAAHLHKCTGMFALNILVKLQSYPALQDLSQG